MLVLRRPIGYPGEVGSTSNEFREVGAGDGNLERTQFFKP